MWIQQGGGGGGGGGGGRGRGGGGGGGLWGYRGVQRGYDVPLLSSLPKGGRKMD